MNGFDDLGEAMRAHQAAGGEPVLQHVAAVQPADARVTPLRADLGKLKPKARGLLASVTLAQDMAPVLDRPYLIKGWLDRGDLSVLFGPSNTGKTFLAIDIAHHVAKGLEWNNRRTLAARVMYLAVEGGSNFATRLAPLSNPSFWVLPVPLTLTGRESAATALAEMLLHLAAIGGRFDLIIIDTMARVMGSADENTALGIDDLVRNCDHIRRVTGAHIMLVHHTGKDTSRGARGSNSLRAAIETEIELTRDDDTGLITAKLSKQRDGPTGYKFTYRLRQVEIGADQDGDPVTTCLVEPADPGHAGRAVRSEAAQRALGLLDKALTEGGELIRRPNYPGTPSVTLGAWRDACLKEGALSDAKERDDRGRVFRRVRSDLEEERTVLVRDDRVWRVQP